MRSGGRGARRRSPPVACNTRRSRCNRGRAHRKRSLRPHLRSCSTLPHIYWHTRRHTRKRTQAHAQTHAGTHANARRHARNEAKQQAGRARRFRVLFDCERWRVEQARARWLQRKHAHSTGATGDDRLLDGHSDQVPRERGRRLMPVTHRTATQSFLVHLAMARGGRGRCLC